MSQTLKGFIRGTCSKMKNQNIQSIDLELMACSLFDIDRSKLLSYNIPLNQIPDKPLASNLEWCFMSTGVGSASIPFLLSGF